MADLQNIPDIEPDDSTAIAVDFALVVSRMLESVKSDPEQLRSAIYELARSKLRDQLRLTPSDERKKMRNALETAIRGVEDFAQRKDFQVSPPARPLLPPVPPTEQILLEDGSNEAPRPLAPSWRPGASKEQAAGGRNSGRSQARSNGVAFRFFMLIVAVCAITSLLVYRKNIPLSLAHLTSFKLSSQQPGSKPSPAPAQSQPTTSVQTSIAPQSDVAAAPQEQQPNMLPSSYGIYAVSDGKLFGLDTLQGRPPDPRIAISGAITIPASTTLPDGHVKFVVYRREALGSAPDHADIRVVARIVRAMSFNGGKPQIVKTGDTWVIRNIFFTYRVAPIKDNPEMYEIRNEDPHFALPPGRYALVLNNAAYDFRIDGTVTDTRQCLEETQAANGMFYSECKAN
jgi:hypothetical protein